MINHWLKEAKRKLATQPDAPPDVVFDRLRAQGLIDEEGQVLGHLRRWDAHLAIIAIDETRNQKPIQHFKCLKPFFGIPGGATIAVSRENLVKDLREGKPVITATWDDRLKMWQESKPVHITGGGALRIDDKDEPGDYLGNLPSFRWTPSC